MLYVLAITLFLVIFALIVKNYNALVLVFLGMGMAVYFIKNPDFFQKMNISVRSLPIHWSRYFWIYGTLKICLVFLSVFYFGPWLNSHFNLTNGIEKSLVETFNLQQWVMVVIAALCIAPLTEEIFFRYYLLMKMNSLGFFSIIISAIIFSLFHNDFLSSFAAGMIYGILYRKTGCLLLSIALHISNNLALLLMIAAGTFDLIDVQQHEPFFLLFHTVAMSLIWTILYSIQSTLNRRPCIESDS